MEISRKFFSQGGLYTSIAHLPNSEYELALTGPKGVYIIGNFRTRKRVIEEERELRRIVWG